METRAQKTPPPAGDKTLIVTSRQLTSTSSCNTPMCDDDADGSKVVEKLPTPTPTRSSRIYCMICGLESHSSIRLVRCKSCDKHFHAHCASLPLPPEEGNLFCRHSCYATYNKKHGHKGPVFRHGDYPRLATQIQSVLQEKSDRIQVRRQLPLHDVSTSRGRGRGRTRGRGRGRGRGGGRTAGIKRALEGDNDDEVSHSSLGITSMEGEVGERSSVSTPRSTTTAMTSYPRQNATSVLNSNSNKNALHQEDDDKNSQLASRSVSPASRRPSWGFDAEQENHFRNAHLTVPASSGMQVSRSTRGEYASMSAFDSTGTEEARPRHGQYPNPHSRQEVSHIHQSPSGFNSVSTFYDGIVPGTMPPPMPNQRILGIQPPPMQQRLDEEVPHRRGFKPPYCGSAVGPTPSSSPYANSQHADLPQGSRNGPPPNASNFGPQGQFPPQTPSQLRMRRHTPNIPWRNPSAFPSEVYERFSCHSDDANHVFRIDLSPVFADKATKLYQTEIDFFFRCFESPDVSLVVKGMSSELNQYIWAWPFILECCGNDTHFAFDHFQFKRNTDTDLPELAYVGELHLSMTSFNSYLEKYLSNASGKDVVVLEDHVTKKTITVVASENIIALNNLVLAKHCAQLYNDLIKGFQWDVFAGGIHCLLQYLPQSSWHAKFSSPRLHFNFPGARGSLCDPGNGTTDIAYQVLVGSLELVIFERFEPQSRAEFNHILQRSGYDRERRTMLLDAHLRALRSAGFTFSTVLLQDGEFVHVNKGRHHFWRVVEKDSISGSINAPCVFLSWEWVYQGVSQRGISTECWFAMNNASMCTDGWVFDPRRAIVEAAKCGVAIVRTGQFLRSALASGRPRTSPLLSFTSASAAINRTEVAQRQAQMVLFLESILPCLVGIVEEAYELGVSRPDDSDEFRKMFDDEIMWRTVDADLRHPPAENAENYSCCICKQEFTNLYKQCLGCSVYSRRCRPNMTYPIFRICLRCHSQPDQHHFKPRKIASYYDKLLSSEGHTGLLPATRRYQTVRSYFKCRCVPSLRCAYCGGCESCSCVCHTLFQTRFRFTAPANLERLQADVDAVVKYHQQQLQQQQQQQPQQQQR